MKFFQSELMRTDKEAKSKAVMLCCFVLMAFAPFFLSSYRVLLLSKVFLISICAMSNTFLSGYGGMSSFAHISFYGITAYTIAIGVVTFHQPYWLMALLGIVLTLIVASLYALVSVRTSGRYFFQISMAFLQLVYLTVITAADLTRGIAGIAGIPAPTVFGVELKGRVLLFYLLLAVVVIAYLLFKRLVRSPFGLSLRGVRDNDRKLAALGFNVNRQKFVAIVISAFFCSIAGILWCILFNVIAPENVSSNWAIILMFISVLGCTTKLEGAFLGGIIYFFAEDWLSTTTNRYRMIVGACFILLVLFCQNGLLGVNYKQAFGKIKEDIVSLRRKIFKTAA